MNNDLLVLLLKVTPNMVKSVMANLTIMSAGQP